MGYQEEIEAEQKGAWPMPDLHMSQEQSGHTLPFRPDTFSTVCCQNNEWVAQPHRRAPTSHYELGPHTEQNVTL